MVMVIVLSGPLRLSLYSVILLYGSFTSLVDLRQKTLKNFFLQTTSFIHLADTSSDFADGFLLIFLIDPLQLKISLYFFDFRLFLTIFTPVTFVECFSLFRRRPVECLIDQPRTLVV